MKVTSIWRLLSRRSERKTSRPERKAWNPRSQLDLERLESRELLSVVPRITSVAPPDGSTTSNPHPAITVTFNERMDPNDVTNPANYSILSASGEPVVINSVSYDSVRAMVTLQYTGPNNGNLSSDQYTLFVHGDHLHDVNDQFLLAPPGQLVVANTGGFINTPTVSLVGMPGDGKLQAISNIAPPFQDFASTFTPAATTIADVTGDGRPDLIMAGTQGTAPTVYIFPGLPGGGFSNTPLNPLALPAKATPTAVTTGDFNKDGALDIAVADSGTNDVTVFLNNGQGAFTTSTTYAVGKGPVGLVAADFNGDGNRDLAVVDSGQDGVQVLPGNSNGVFGTPVTFTTGRTGLTGIAAGNLTATPGHFPDIAVSSGNGVAVLTNTTSGVGGTINFAAGNPISTAQTSSIAIGDLNGDGLNDIATTGNSASSNVFVFLNSGAGFLPAATYNGGNFVKKIAIGDVNGDGKKDLLVIDSTAGLSGSQLAVLLNQGAGTFGQPSFYQVDVTPVDLALHFNAGGVVDLAAVANTFGADVSVLRAKGDGTFLVSNDFLQPQASTSLSAVVSGDLNGDGVPDIVMADSINGDVFILLSQPGGGYSNPITIKVGNNPVALALADLEGIGRPDIIVVNQGDSTVQVIANNGGGNFTPLVAKPVGKVPTGVAVGDFNGDGLPDLAVSHDNNGTSSTTVGDQGVSILLNQGNRTFATATEYLTGVDAVGVAVADFNKDGHPDVAVLDGSLTGKVDVLQGAGNGTFTFDQRNSFFAGELPTSITVGDMNNDGLPDIVVTARSQPQSTTFLTVATVEVLLNTGIGINFSQPLEHVVTTDPAISLANVSIVHVNQDLYPDIVASVGQRFTFPNTIVAMLGLGDGSVTDPQYYATNGSGQVAPSFLAVASDPFLRVTTFTVQTPNVNPNLIRNGTFEQLDLSGEKGSLTAWNQASETTVSDQPVGHGSWLVQHGAVSPIGEVPVPIAPQGQFAAMLDEPNPSLLYPSADGAFASINGSTVTAADYEGAHVLYQDFTIPTTATQVLLTYSLYVNNNDPLNTVGWTNPATTPALDFFPNQVPSQQTPNQQVRVDIMDPNANLFDVNAGPGGGVLLNLFQTEPGDPRVFGYIVNPETASPTLTMTINLSAFKGRTIRLRIGEVNNQGKLIVGLDNVKVQAFYMATQPPAISNLRLRNPGVGATNTFGGDSTDTTIIGQVSDEGGPNNVASVIVDLNNDGNFNGPDDIATHTFDAEGNFAITLPPDMLPGQYTVGIVAVDAAGNMSQIYSFTFVLQGPSLTTWQAEGPGPILFSGPGVQYHTVSGDITAEAVDPRDPSGNIIYVGTDNGGIWKTTDGGNDWTPVTGNVTGTNGTPVAIPIGALTIDPNNPDSVWAGLGIASSALTAKPGSGLLHSTDAGRTWILVAPTIFAGARITNFQISDHNPNTSSPVRMYVSVASGGMFGPGLYESTDGGVTWKNALIPTGPSANMFLDAGGTLPAGTALASVTDVEIDRLSNNEEIIWVGLGNIGLAPASISTGVWKSTDGGLSFFQVTGGHDTKGVAVRSQFLPAGDPNVALENQLVPSWPGDSVHMSYDIGRVTIALPGSTERLGADGFLHPVGSPADEGVAYVYLNNRSSVPFDNNTGGDPNNRSGIFKTVTGGSSWTHVMLRERVNNFEEPGTALENWEDIILAGGSTDTDTVGSLVVDPTNSNVVYFGGSTRYTSLDVLDTRAHALLRIDTTNMRDTRYASPWILLPFTIYPNDGDDIYKRNDAIVTSKPTTLSTTEIQGTYPGSPVGPGGGYQGEGVFWYDLEMQTSGTSDFSQLQLPPVIHALTFDGQGRLLVGTDGGIWRGVNQSWTYDTTSGGTGIESLLGVRQPTEGGMHFTDLNGNLQIADQTSVAIDPIDPHVIDSSQASLGWAQTTGGLQWISTNDTTLGPQLPDPFDGPAPDAGIVRVAPANPATPGNPSIVYRTYANVPPLINPPEQFEISLEGGAQGTFQPITQGIDLTGLAKFPVFGVNPVLSTDTGMPLPELLYAGNRLFESDNGALPGSADPWQQVSETLTSNGDFVTALAFGPTGMDVFYVGTNQGKVFVDLHGGGDGFPLRNTGLPALPVGGIVTDPDPSDPTSYLKAYVTFGGFGTGKGHVFYTANGGKTWTNITGNLPDVPAYGLAFDYRKFPPTGNLPATPQGTLYVGTEVGVFESINNGQTWQRLGQGLPNVPVVDIQFNATLEKLVVATQGRGTYQISTDRIGPRVIGALPVNPQMPGVADVIVTFNENTDPRTFQPSQVTITGPNGPIAPQQIIDLDPRNHTSYEITFPAQSADGTYTVTIGPDITDLTGNPMDQNGNLLNGETPGDKFTFQFTINTTDDGRFTTGLYHDVLNRAADTQGFLHFLSGVDTARFQQLQTIATAVLIGGEARSALITSDYQSLLRRTPSSSEVAAWLQALNQGATPEFIQVAMTGSDEYYYLDAGGTDPSYIKQLYVDLLMRQADPTGLNTFVLQMDSQEQSSRGPLVNALVQSPEYKADLTNAAYLKFLGRAASPSDVNTWVGRLGVNATDEQFFATLIGSQEYFNNHGGTNQSWLNAAYVDILNRTPDSGGQAALLAQLQAGTSRFTVAMELLTSTEYRQNLIRNDFTKYLGRLPGQPDYAAYLSAFANGFTDEQAIISIVASVEYFQKQTTGTATQTQMDANWVAGAYHDILGRAPDSTGAANFEADLAQAERGIHATVAGQFVGSTEYRVALINSIYESYLARPAAAAEISLWLPVLAQPSAGPGAPSADETIRATVLSSAEYFFRQKTTDTPPQETDQTWLTSIYTNVLHRAPDPAGYNSLLVSLLGGGYQTQRQLAATALLGSTESRSDVLTTLYKHYLQRPPTPAELATDLASGRTDEQEIQHLVTTSEYINLVTQGTGSNSAWLNAIYLAILGRNRDAGSQPLLDGLNNGTLTKLQVAGVLLSSTEYRDDVINSIYEQYLGRAALPSDLTGWVNAINAGTTDEQIRATVLASAEYFLRPHLYP
jgi:hypothetical protein